jgi:hypothetical protein
MITDTMGAPELARASRVELNSDVAVKIRILA